MRDLSKPELEKQRSLVAGIGFGDHSETYVVTTMQKLQQVIGADVESIQEVLNELRASRAI